MPKVEENEGVVSVEIKDIVNLDSANLRNIAEILKQIVQSPLNSLKEDMTEMRGVVGNLSSKMGGLEMSMSKLLDRCPLQHQRVEERIGELITRVSTLETTASTNTKMIIENTSWSRGTMLGIAKTLGAIGFGAGVLATILKAIGKL